MACNKIILSKKQKSIIKKLNDPTYTISYIEEFINRKDTVFNNAPVALIIMGCHGFLDAVKRIEKLEAQSA